MSTRIKHAQIDATDVHEFYVDNYWDGIVDYGVAINLAIDAARDVRGGKIVFTRTATVTTPINATNLGGVIFEGRGGSNVDPAYGAPIITGKMTGVFIDCTGSDDITFRDFSFSGDATITPDVGILIARASAGGGNGSKFNFEGVRTPFFAKFNYAAIYSYAGEEQTWYNCEISNSTPNANVVIFTCKNNITTTGIAPQTSAFVTIQTGEWSQTNIAMYNCEFTEIGGGAASNIFFIDGLHDFSIFGGFSICSDNDNAGDPAFPTGATFYIYTGNAGCSSWNISGFREEPANNQWSWWFTNNGLHQEFHDWTILGYHSEALVDILNMQSFGKFYGLFVKNVRAAGTGIELIFHDIDDGFIHHENSVTVDGTARYSDIRANAPTIADSESGQFTDHNAGGRTYTDYGVVHNRGITATVDFDVADFTTDGAAHDLDISAVVPNGAAMVYLSVVVTDDAVGNIIQFKQSTATNLNNSVCSSMVANVPSYYDITVPLGNRPTLAQISYIASNTTFSTIDVTVKGWSF